MKIRKVIVALAAVLVPFLVFRVGSGLTEQQNVTLRDYTVSENEKTLTLHAAVFPPIAPTHDLPARQCIYLHCIIGIGRNRIALSFNIINTFYCRNFVHQHCILRIYAIYSYKLRKRAAAAFG